MPGEAGPGVTNHSGRCLPASRTAHTHARALCSRESMALLYALATAGKTPPRAPSCLHPVAVPFPLGALARNHLRPPAMPPTFLRGSVLDEINRNCGRTYDLAPGPAGWHHGRHQHRRDRCLRSEVVRHPRSVPRRQFTADLREGARDHAAATQHRRELAQPRYRRERKVSVRTELQERVRATRKTDDEEEQSPNSAKRSSITSMLRLLARCERRPASRIWLRRCQCCGWGVMHA